MAVRNGIRQREIDLGPWQPSLERVQSWAQFLQATGRYDTVTVQSNGQAPVPDYVPDPSGMSLPDDDLFIEADA